MAAALQKLRLSAICAVFTYLIFNKVVDALDSVEKCNDTVSKLAECWKWHTSLQTLDCSFVNTTSLVKCGIIHKYDLQNCDQVGGYQYGWESKHRERLYKFAMEILCFEGNFLKAFREDDNCWKQAKECAVPLVQIPKEVLDQHCQNATELINECKHHTSYRTTSCSSLINKYIDRLMEKSTYCGAAALLVQISLILAAYIYYLTVT